MFSRINQAVIQDFLGWSPAVGILGARQVGKTTLAKAFADNPETGIYLDLDSPQAQARLGNASAFFEANRHRLVVLDEIQNQPEILQLLRGEIDADRRPGRFLIMGSASFKLLKQSKSLAGRLALVDMAPLLLHEVYENFADTQTLWLRGGASRADVLGQVIARSVSWGVLVVAIIFGMRPRLAEAKPVNP